MFWMRIWASAIVSKYVFVTLIRGGGVCVPFLLLLWWIWLGFLQWGNRWAYLWPWPKFLGNGWHITTLQYVHRWKNFDSVKLTAAKMRWPDSASRATKQFPSDAGLTYTNKPNMTLTWAGLGYPWLGSSLLVICQATNHSSTDQFNKVRYKGYMRMGLTKNTQLQ